LLKLPDGAGTCANDSRKLVLSEPRRSASAADQWGELHEGNRRKNSSICLWFATAGDQGSSAGVRGRLSGGSD
jgi:hypothetical protein